MTFCILFEHLRFFVLFEHLHYHSCKHSNIQLVKDAQDAKIIKIVTNTLKYESLHAILLNTKLRWHMIVAMELF
jgi:hypothetical protein